MAGLSSDTLLEVWDLGRGRHLLDRALLVLARAYPDRSRGELASLAVGRRDALLLELRQALLGDHLWLQSHCPDCGNGLEFSALVGELLQSPPDDDPTARLLLLDGYRIQIRRLDSRDLGAALAAGDVAGARKELLRRAVVRCDEAETDRLVEADELPVGVQKAVAEEMSRADPQADFTYGFECPDCGVHWTAAVDVPSLLWTELTGLAQRLLHQIHELASAYGWSESEILALPASRRNFYLRKIAR